MGEDSKLRNIFKIIILVLAIVEWVFNYQGKN